MTIALKGEEIARKLEDSLPGVVVETIESTVIVKEDALFEAAQFLRNTPGLEFDYLTSLTAADYPKYLELIYHLTSIKHNHSLVLKTRCYNRESPEVPSVVSLWNGANFQEREVYDLMGISFTGHPNLRRIFLWEGFQGHPLRKDFSQ